MSSRTARASKPRRGRPPFAGAGRPVVVKLRMSEAELARYAEDAEDQGKTLSEHIRDALEAEHEAISGPSSDSRRR